MLLKTAVLVLGLAGLLGSPAAAFGQQRAGDRSESTLASPLLAGHPRLAESLDRITRGSALWRVEVDALRQTRRRVLILTSDQIAPFNPDGGRETGLFDPATLAEIAVVPDADAGIRAVLVVVNLALVDQAHAERGSFAPERDADLDRILVHELYGHAFPYLLAGDESGRCADPLPDERAADACSIRRENAVRAELGLGRRIDSGLKGLALGQPRAAASGLVLSTRAVR